MSIKPRPDDCCGTPIDPVPLGHVDQERLVAIFRALSDPTRLRIFHLVAAQIEPICACDVGDRFQVSQPTISHHMKVLKEAGLITVSRQGVWAYYAVRPEALEMIRTGLDLIAPVPELTRRRFSLG